MAGIAQARGLDVAVLRSGEAPEAVDVRVPETVFVGKGGFEKALRERIAVPAAVEPAAPARPQVDPLPARRIGRDDRIRLAARLERHFRRPEDVRRLAAAVGVGRDFADRPADGMWAEVLERAERGDRDLEPLVEALRVADPEDALALRLARAPVPA